MLPMKYETCFRHNLHVHSALLNNRTGSERTSYECMSSPFVIPRQADILKEVITQVQWGTHGVHITSCNISFHCLYWTCFTDVRLRCRWTRPRADIYWIDLRENSCDITLIEGGVFAQITPYLRHLAKSIMHLKDFWKSLFEIPLNSIEFATFPFI
jgi:hypothetical protein